MPAWLPPVRRPHDHRASACNGSSGRKGYKMDLFCRIERLKMAVPARKGQVRSHLRQRKLEPVGALYGTGRSAARGTRHAIHCVGSKARPRDPSPNYQTHIDTQRTPVYTYQRHTTSCALSSLRPHTLGIYQHHTDLTRHERLVRDTYRHVIY